MDVLGNFVKLFVMNLQLYEDSKYPVKTTSSGGFLWWLECQQKNNSTYYLRTGRDGTIDENEDCTFDICVSGPNFGHFFEHLLRIGTSRKIEIPQIAFPVYSLHDYRKPVVNIVCKVFKLARYKIAFVDIHGKGCSELGRWEFPKFLIEKETWSTSFIIVLKSSEYAPVKYEVILNESGTIYFQTICILPMKVQFKGNFRFQEETYGFDFDFLPGDLKKQVCKIELPTISNPIDLFTLGLPKDPVELCGNLGQSRIKGTCLLYYTVNMKFDDTNLRARTEMSH